MTTSSTTSRNSRAAAPPVPRRLTVTLLAASALTVMSGATIAPALPGIRAAFAGAADVDLWARLMLTLPALTVALVAPLAGAFAAQVGKKRLLGLALVLYALAGTSGLYLDTLPALLIGRAFLGTAVGLILALSVSYVGDVFVGEARGRFLGTQGAAMSFGGVAFLLLGGLLAGQSWRLPFAIYASSLLVWLAAWQSLPSDPTRDEMRASTEPASAATPAPSPSLIGIYALAAAAMALFYLTPVQVPFLVQGLGAGAVVAGSAIATSTITGGIAALSYGKVRHRFGRMGTAATVLLTMTLGYATVGNATSLPPVFAGLAAVGVGAGLVMPLVNDWLLDRATFAHRPTAAGRLTSSLFAGQFLSPLLFAPLIGRTSLPATFMIAAGAAGVAGVVLAVMAMRSTRIAQG